MVGARACGCQAKRGPEAPLCWGFQARRGGPRFILTTLQQCGTMTALENQTALKIQTEAGELARLRGVRTGSGKGT